MKKDLTARRTYQPWRDAITLVQKLWTDRGIIYLSVFAISSASILTLGLFRGLSPTQLRQAIAAVGVALLPVGLLAGILVRLMIAARRMLRRGARIDSLSTIERLAEVDVICADKTGLFTENRLTVVAMDVADQEVNLTEQHYPGENVSLSDEKMLEISPTQALLLVGGALCGNAELMREDDGRIHAIGNLTDGALMITAARAGFWKGELDRAFPCVSEIPFDLKRKRMTTVHQLSDFSPDVLLGVPVDGMSHVVFTKGAVDKLLYLSKHIWVDGKAELLNTEWKRRIRSAESRLVRQGMRVLAVSFRTESSLPSEQDIERRLTFIGLFGMIDPPRQSIREAVDMCQDMGIRPIVITNDRPATAMKGARELGLPERVTTGADLNQLSEKSFLAAVEDEQVYTRISGKQRLKVMQALQTQNHIVAATSDEDDAQILGAADVSVFLGLAGSKATPVHLTLLDNHFATLVAALREARLAKYGLAFLFRITFAGWVLRTLLLAFVVWQGGALLSILWPLFWINLLFDGGVGLVLGLRR